MMIAFTPLHCCLNAHPGSVKHLIENPQQSRFVKSAISINQQENLILLVLYPY
jgi:hypothetical protein